jgi:acyl carrier protein
VFRLRISAELGIAVGRLSPSARLREDVGLDSVRMLELVLVLDSLGVTVEDEDVTGLTVVDDLYHLYVARLAADEADRAAEVQRSYGIAPLAGRRTVQRPLVPADDGYVQGLMSTGERWPTGRAFGASEVPGTVLAEHLVVDARSAARIGVLAAYDADLRNGTAYLMASFEPRVRGRGWPLEAIVLFVDHLFRTWPLRKVYAEAVGSAAKPIESGLGRLFVEEGRFVAHEYVHGKLCDLRVLSVFRAHWEAVAPRLLSRIHLADDS